VRVAIVGATGLVGEMMRIVLEERDFPLTDLVLMASRRSRGSRQRFKGEWHSVVEMGPTAFEGVDIALFATGAELSREYAITAVKAGAVAIDNSSAFRMDEGVPLVVPEVNPEHLRKHRGIIANPNCSTIQLVVVLWPIHTEYGLKRAVVSTYQSVSGQGKQALMELVDQMKAYCAEEGDTPYSLSPQAKATILDYPIISNVIPQIDDFVDGDDTREEEKMVNEARKIMGLPHLRIAVTCARVPILFSHCESVNVETEKKAEPTEVKDLLSRSKSINVVDDPASKQYPLPLDAANTDMVFVGRIRQDRSVSTGLAMWIVSDNLRKGAATNAVQIAEKLLDLGLL
jgi:aspartate-semialdehyde dehydrogenase